MVIEYKINKKITAEQFIDLLKRSTLAQRRPVDDKQCMQGMIENSNLIVTAWLKDQLIGITRCVTDFHYCCYLSDLAVDSAYQKDGIGKQLQIKTQDQLGSKCKLILIAAPDANSYYRHIGFTNNERCWVLNRDESITA
ncbi:MAG: GNAT family N-acetyltransferase [Saccharospirillaceae bacterium]|nr:GNAT family N-acetyltransferase [Pseudomonadales bacterium]NRB79572.1 GNAT family N-acetyltransferase [Saccharospirillaceae bacterium]